MPTKLVLTPLMLALLAGWLLACHSSQKSTSRTSARLTKPNTETVMEHPNPPPPALLSSQKGPADSQVDLLKAQVNGSILTVELQYKPGSVDKPRSSGVIPSSYTLDGVSVLDEANTKTYSVLKDESGNYMASPLQTEQGQQRITMTIPSGKDKPVSVWFKFPAPPLETKTVSITIPDVGVYQHIPLSR